MFELTFCMFLLYIKKYEYTKNTQARKPIKDLCVSSFDL